MDLSAEIDRAVEELECEDFASILEAAIYDLLAETPNPPPPTTMYSQADAYPQGQYLPYQWPVDDVTAAAVGDPAAPSYPYGDSPVVILPRDVEQNLRPVGVANGHMVYEMPAEFLAPPDSVVPPVDTFNSKKRKRYTQPDDGGPYIKKPPNAFMLYMREQRPNVEADIKNRGNAAVNVVLGQRWKSLTEEERAKYYVQADEERLLHAQRNPGWSSKNNYGKKRKRCRRKAPTNVEASSSAPEEVLQQAKRRCVTPTVTPVIEASTSQAEVMMEPCPLQTITIAEEDFRELLDIPSYPLFHT